MNLKLFIRQYKEQIRMAAIILAVLVGILAGVVPFGQRTASLWSQVRTLKGDVATLQGKVATLELLDENELRSDALTLASAVPPDKSLDTVMTTLDAVSGAASVTLLDVSLSKPGSIATESAVKQSATEKKMGSNILPVSVRVRGSYEGVKQFVSQVGAVRRVFQIQTVGVNFIGNLVDAQVSLDAFYFPYPSNVGRTLTPITAVTDEEKNIVLQMSKLPLASAVPVSTVSATVSVGKTDPFSL